MKWLHDNIVDNKPESLSGCLALVLRPMSEVQQGRMEANQMFPDREILAMRVAEEANLRGINFVCSRSDLRYYKCTPGQDFQSLLITQSI